MSEQKTTQDPALISYPIYNAEGEMAPTNSNMKKLFILIFVISIFIKGNCQKTFTSYYDIFELQKKEVYTISKSGNITGTYYHYHQSGILAEKTQYLEGEKNGVSEEYEDKTQAVLVRANYKSGKLNGKYETWTRQWTAPYKLVQNKSCTIKDGKKDGPYKEWYDNGKLRYDHNYEMGKFKGVQKNYFDDGKLEIEANYKEGELHGLYKAFYNNGQIKKDAYYQNGDVQGVYKEFYSNGQLIFTSNYVNGKADGLYQEWYENGQIRILSNYDNGKLIDEYRCVYENDKKTQSRATIILPDGGKNIIDSLFHEGELTLVKKEGERTWYKKGGIVSKWYGRGKIGEFFVEDSVIYSNVGNDSIIFKYSDKNKSKLLRKENYIIKEGKANMISYWDLKEEQAKQEQELKRKQEEERKIKEEKARKEEEQQKKQIEKKTLAEFRSIAQDLSDIDIRDRTQYPPYLKIRIREIVGTEYKKEFYYSKIVDILIETNTKLNYEWKKNGQYFEDKVQLYEAYISDNYKTVLKENKKKSKK